MNVWSRRKTTTNPWRRKNILIKARNFLVFQGDVEAIATQKPQDLTRLIEQVSGSIEHKAGYDKLKAELDQAAEQQTFQLNRRRGINSEIRQYQEQKREADNFQKKAGERDDAIVTHVLWKLYHLQRQIEESSADIQKHQDELKEYRRGIEKYGKGLDAAKKDHALGSRNVGKVEKLIKGKDKEIEDKTSSLVPIDEQNIRLESATHKICQSSEHHYQRTKHTSYVRDATGEGLEHRRESADSMAERMGAECQSARRSIERCGSPAVHSLT